MRIYSRPASARQYRAILRLSGQDMTGTHLTSGEAGRIIRTLVETYKYKARRKREVVGK